MKYLVTSTDGAAGMSGVPLDRLHELKKGLKEAIDTGRVDSAHAIVGGGHVFVVNADSNAHLAEILHRVHAHDVDVKPIVSTMDLIDAHIEDRQSRTDH